MNDRLKELKAGAAAPDDVAITIEGDGKSVSCVSPFCVFNNVTYNVNWQIRAVLLKRRNIWLNFFLPLRS